MKKRLGNTVHKTARFFNKMDDIFNAEPEFFSYRENMRKVPLEKKTLYYPNIPIYIGEAGDTYDKKRSLAMLHFYAYKTYAGDKISIKLTGAVSEVVNPTDDQKQRVPFEEQKSSLIELMRSVDKKRVKDLDIVNIEDEHPELFMVLRGG
jgi:hypothetical protein